MISNAVRCLGGNHKDCGVFRFVVAFDMIRRKWTLRLVLRSTVRVLAGMSQRTFIEFARPAAADIKHHQADRTADRSVGAIARAESIATAIHPDFSGYRSIHD